MDDLTDCRPWYYDVPLLDSLTHAYLTLTRHSEFQDGDAEADEDRNRGIFTRRDGLCRLGHRTPRVWRPGETVRH